MRKLAWSFFNISSFRRVFIAYILPVSVFCTTRTYGIASSSARMKHDSLRRVIRTSPKAPFPITFTVRKSSNPSFVRRSLRNADSRLPSCCSCRCFRSSDIVISAASFRSSSTRLQQLSLYDHDAKVCIHTSDCVQWPPLPPPCSNARA